MSLSKNKKSQIKEYILDKIGDNDDVVDKVQKCFEISATTVYRYLDELIKDGDIKRKKRGKYVLLEKQYNFSYENVGLEEDVIFAKDIRPILLEQNLPTNVMNIWYYAFTASSHQCIYHLFYLLYFNLTCYSIRSRDLLQSTLAMGTNRPF